MLHQQDSSTSKSSDDAVLNPPWPERQSMKSLGQPSFHLLLHRLLHRMECDEKLSLNLMLNSWEAQIANVRRTMF